MNLRNYTSSVPVSKTVAKIEELLAQAGARGISKQYHDCKLIAIFFTVAGPTGRDMCFQLPANVHNVMAVMLKDVKRPRRGTTEKVKDQAERTAWKLIQDWVHVQVSLIRMQQADFLQVFLPYAWDGEKTLYQAMRDNDFKQLPWNG